MAIVTTNSLIEGMSGKFGRSLVFRTMRGKTFISALGSKPNKKKESVAQRNTRTTFTQAANWAQTILLNPEKKAYYKQRAKVLKLPNAYTAAITDYMRKPKVAVIKQGNAITYSVSKHGFTLSDVKVKTETTSDPLKVVIRQYKDSWILRYEPDAGNITCALTLIITDNARKSTTITAYG